nr:MAG TPA: hypothetical protein [Caudoviricetes sp.]DAY35084.1 MAG TPA: hypothetical protein [Caudoviricetes sp.]
MCKLLLGGLSKSLFHGTLCIRNLGRLRNKSQPEKAVYRNVRSFFLLL